MVLRRSRLLSVKKVICCYVKVRQIVRRCRKSAATVDKMAAALGKVVRISELPLLRQIAGRVPRRLRWGNVRKQHDRMFTLIAQPTSVGIGAARFRRCVPRQHDQVRHQVYGLCAT